MEYPVAPRQRERLSRHVLSQLVCLGNHTVTGLLSTSGRQFLDWSADYRMYAYERVDPQRLFEPVRRWLCENTKGAVVVGVDDTRVPKRGAKIHGVKYMRDPMGPPFHINFMRAQRFVQISMASPGSGGQARMIPVDWVHAPVPHKPRPQASDEQWRDYRAQSRAGRVASIGAQRLGDLRAWLDANGAQGRRLWGVVDGSFCNNTMLRSLPHNTVLVGRIRRDTKLYHLPHEQPQGRGRPRLYGNRAPTPEQVRHDDAYPWQSIEVFFGGRRRQLRVKQLAPVRWRAAGAQLNLQLIVIAPTRYRLTKGGKTYYRKPAYLICTDAQAPLQDALQHYLWRWDIEVNFRDLKTLLGLGEAQVRTPAAVQNVTGTAVAAYAMLLVAAASCRHPNKDTQQLPPPKWHPNKRSRPTTMGLIQNLRRELWALSINFSSFVSHQLPDTKPQKNLTHLESAILYASSYS